MKDLKNILANAQEEGLHNNDEYKGRRFKVTAEEADNVYLTAEELDALAKVDLSTKAQGYSDARDVFLAGCWLAQRVSRLQSPFTRKHRNTQGNRPCW